MDNQGNTQTNNPVENVQSAQPVPSQPIVSQPVVNNTETPPKNGNKSLLYLAVIVMLIILILGAVFISGFFGNSSKKENIVQQPQPTATPTQTQEEQEVSQEPITSQQDAANALQQVDSSNPDEVGAELDQNTADASSFSQ